MTRKVTWSFVLLCSRVVQRFKTFTSSVETPKSVVEQCLAFNVEVHKKVAPNLGEGVLHILKQCPGDFWALSVDILVFPGPVG